MKNLFKYVSFLFIFVIALFLFACKKTEYVKVYFLDRDDNLITQTNAIVGQAFDKFPFVGITDGTYYLWDKENCEYSLDNVTEAIYIYGDVEKVDVTYNFYLNNEFNSSYTDKYSNEYIMPSLPKNAHITNEVIEKDKNDPTHYIYKVYLTYEIVLPEYNVEFYDGKNEVLDTLTYKEGDELTLPTYEKDGYIFEGWFLNDISCTPYEKIEKGTDANLKLYARFTESEVHERLTLPSTKYHFTGIKKVPTSVNGVFTYQPILPLGVDSSAMNYDWESSNTSVATISIYSSLTAKSAGYTIITGKLKSNPSVIVNAVFKVTSEGISLSNEEEANTINVFTVTFKGKNNEIIATKKVVGNGHVIYPVPPTYDGYAFVGWDKDNYNITEDTVINALYESGKTNNYVGKKFSILGDSISTYQDYIPEGFSCFYPYPTADVRDYNQTWWMRVINKLGGTLFLNNSYSGSCVAHDTLSSTYKQHRIDYLNVQGQYADCLIIYMGSNDAASSVVSLKNFDERYKIQLDLIKETCPNMEIILCTLAKSKLYTDANQASYNEVIRKYASEYNLTLIDLENVDITNALVDSAHPKQEGMNILASEILKNLIK